jgi:tetratricopeptide (TPR) repeat protein
MDLLDNVDGVEMATDGTESEFEKNEQPGEAGGIAAGGSPVAESPVTGSQLGGSPAVTAHEGIRAFDQQGREVVIPREQWRTEVLPNLLKEVWEQPENLYFVLLNSYNDGFFAEVSEAAQHLYEIDLIPARGACMWSIVLTQLGRLEEAQAVLEGFLENNPVDGSVLVNLAKVYAAQGESGKADETLWKALELEPNLDNGLGMYAAQAEQRGGAQAAEEALARVAALPASWRAQVWLARAALQRGDLPMARGLYVHALDRAPRPVPAELLMQMSGDLGTGGHLAELIDLTAPYYLPETHGLPVGNNLIKANFDLGRMSSAELLKNTLVRINSQLNRPDWAQTIAFWDAEIARVRGRIAGAAGTQNGGGLQIGMLRVDGPIWMPNGSPAAAIFGAKPSQGPSVTFLGGTAETPGETSDLANRTPVEAQQADLLARMTRALPLFFAEQTELLTGAHGRAMLPWAVGAASGFVVSGAPWSDEMAVQTLGAPTAQPSNWADYVVTVHIDAEVEPWTAMLNFVRTLDGARIGELEAEFSPEHPEQGLLPLAVEVVELLSAASGESAQRTGLAAEYQVPQGDSFAGYLLRLEQLLAVRCAGMPGVPPNFLSGENDILAGEIALCQAEPENIAARLLLLETMTALERAKPGAAAAFREPVEQLMAEHPLSSINVAFT